ncbi:hypothetical protein BTH38_04645 [Bacillus toyonensis]|uniref:hypothetical protein n=1 Tax=Bacillus toyonensis TaxID=155322 RepID=UPI000A19C036|nr:hypothetical protein [Bacillus toyonensis]OSM14690.1 hypothetical protein BTH38_04645 [Bacillus toyonensis]
MRKERTDSIEVVGKRFDTNSCNSFTVLRRTNEMRGTNYLYEIEFDEVNGVKYKTLVTKSNISNRGIRNPFYPKVAGVGYTGNAQRFDHEIIYSRWNGILQRCYNKKDKRYKHYGATGARVCERWHNFEYFLEDFVKLHGFDEEKLDQLEIDKDFIGDGQRLYSPETCILVSKEENNKEMQERTKHRKFMAIAPDGTKHISNNQSLFAKLHGLKPSNVSAALNGRLKKYKKWTFIYLEEKKNDKTYQTYNRVS